MARDWLATLSPAHPMRFAEDFYLHYPKVAVGQWPPVFHGLLGLWTLAFGASIAAVATCMALLAAGAAFVVRSVLRPTYGGAVGLLGGALFLALPPVQKLSGAAMTEVPLALVGTLAALAFGRYVDRGRLRDVLAFGGLASVAVLTKGSGLALALVPPLALLLAGRPALLLRPTLWTAALVVGLTCGPWYAVTLPISRGTWAGGSSPSLAYVAEAAPAYARGLVDLGGPVVAACALVGLVDRLRAPNAGGAWPALAAWVVALLALHVVVPSSVEARHLVVLAPAWVAFAVAGAARVGRAGAALALRRHSARVGAAVGSRTGIVATVALAAAFGSTGFDRETKDWRGFGECAAALLDDPELHGAPLLVASGATGEGLFVAGVALADRPRRSTVVLRASKVLARASWSGDDYEVRFDTIGELEDWLTGVPVAAVVLDRSTPARHRFAHFDLLREMVDSDPDRWLESGRWDVVRDGARHDRALIAYRLHGFRELPRRELGIDDVLDRERPSF